MKSGLKRNLENGSDSSGNVKRRQIDGTKKEKIGTIMHPSPKVDYPECLSNLNFRFDGKMFMNDIELKNLLNGDTCESGGGKTSEQLR